jgi:hypothetical protein
MRHVPRPQDMSAHRNGQEIRQATRRIASCCGGSRGHAYGILADKPTLRATDRCLACCARQNPLPNWRQQRPASRATGFPCAVLNQCRFRFAVRETAMLACNRRAGCNRGVVATGADNECAPFGSCSSWITKAHCRASASRAFTHPTNHRPIRKLPLRHCPTNEGKADNAGARSVRKCRGLWSSSACRPRPC